MLRMFLPMVIFLAIEAYLFIYVLIPYLRFDQFQFWDAAGHYFAAWFQRYYLFPHLTGWNPFFFGGYPQGTFYSPLYHYLIALLSFPFGLPLAFKLLTMASIAALPFSIYYLARKLKFNSNESAVMTFLAMIPVCGLALANGGTLFSQFVVGLGSHSLALPVFLFYFGKLKEQVEKLKEGEISSLNFALLTGVAVALVLLHFVAAMAAAAVALIIILYHLNRKVMVFAIKHAAITSLICAFFLLPFVAYAGLTENPGTILSMGFFLTVPSFLLILLGGAVSVWDREERFDRVYFTLLAIFAVMVFMDFGQIGMPMHAYRFIIFFLLLAWMLPVKLVFNRLEGKAVKFLLFAVFLILAAWQLSIMILNNPRHQINYNQIFLYDRYASSQPYREDFKLNKLEGRMLLLEASDRLTPRALEHILARVTGNCMLKGLFAESSAHAGYVNWLNGKVFHLLSSKEGAKGQNLMNIAKLFNLFRVNYILSEAPIKKLKLLKKLAVRKGKADYHLYKIGDYSAAELLPYRPYCTEESWTAVTQQWFESPDPRVLVKMRELPLRVASKQDTVKVVEEKISPAVLRLKVQAREDVPILIKTAYFPRWKAWVNGRPVKIYPVAPSFMLIYGKGDVKLEYGAAAVDQIGGALTLLGLIWLGVEIYCGRRKRD